VRAGFGLLRWSATNYGAESERQKCLPVKKPFEFTLVEYDVHLMIFSVGNDNYEPSIPPLLHG
jgi:hypothetical protein